MMRLLRVAWLLAILMSLAHSALAADLPRRPVVRILIAGGSGAATQVLKARLERTWQKLDATIVTRSIPAMKVRDVLAPHAAGETARVWLDLGSPQVAILYVVEAGNVFERKISLEQGLDNVALELLEVVTTSTVQAVLAGGHLGVTRAEFTQSLPPVTAAPRPAPVPRLVVWAGLTYQAALFAPSKLAHGPSLEAQLDWRALRFGLELRGRFPFRVGTDADTLSLAPQSVRLGVGRVFSLGPSLEWVASFAGGADVTRVRLSSSNPNIDATEPFWSATPVVSPLLRVDYRSGPVRAGVLLSADLDLWTTSYVVSGATAPVWSPWRVRPSLGVGGAYAF